MSRMHHYLNELQRQPYYRAVPFTPPKNIQQKLHFDAAAQFEAEQRMLFENRARELINLENSSGDFNTRGSGILQNTYLQPNGLSTYLQPNGLSLYLTP